MIGSGISITNRRPLGSGPAPAPTPSVALSAPQSQTEGNSGTKTFTYTVTRSVTAGAVSVAWSFAAGTTSAADYQGGTLPTGGTVNFADGVATATFTITTVGDTTVEGDESFTVSIAAPAGYVLGVPSAATGTILNDDAAPTVNANTYYAEGDSITAPDGSYTRQYAAANPALAFTSLAVGGQGLSHFVSRVPTIQSADPEFASLLAGANDQASYANVRDQWIVPVRAGGTKVILVSTLPQNPATHDFHNIHAATYNPQAETGFLAGAFDGFVDMRKSPMATWSAAYFGDYVHPTQAGQNVLAAMFRGEFNRLRGIANEVAPFTFTDASGAAASTVVTSDAVMVYGLGYGETKPISVTGGEYRKNGGAFTTTAGTVTNGDTVQVRGTSAAGAGASVNVALTIGGVSDTFTIGTAASSALATTYRSSGVGNNGFNPNFTFSTVPFFAGENIVAIMGSVGNAAPSAVALGGTTGTKLAEVVGGENRHISFWKVSKATGGSGNLVITSGSVHSISYALWSTDAGATFEGEASLSFNYHNDPIRTGLIAIPSGGSVLIAANCGNAGATITPEGGTIEDDEFVDPGNWKFWVGHLGSGNQPGITGLAFQGAQMLAVSVKP